MAGQRLALVGIALIATLSVDASAELVRGGAVKVTAPAPAPPPSVTSPSGPPPSAPYEVNPDDVRYTGAAYSGSNLFGSGYNGIRTLGLDLGVLDAGEIKRARDSALGGDLFTGQVMLLHAIARHLIPLEESRGASLGVLATLAGYYIAVASDCNLPTAPIEAALDKILRDGSVAPSEAERHKLTMIQLRGAFAGAGTVLGCVEAKRQVDIALQVKAH
jgi:hypothetical protein